MIRFECDYSEGAHPVILDLLAKTNLEQTPGYSEDPYCEEARALVRAYCNAPDAAIHFLVGGTQANVTIIASVLKPYQGVLCAETGHIHVHETGAVEATGHKALALPQTDGKITAAQVEAAYLKQKNDGSHEHIVQPGMVYISHPTECGTLYTKEELTALSETCRKCGLPLFLDGARLGYGLASPGSDLSAEDVATLCDIFTVGGTKVGALFGEAVVITNPALQKDFRYMIKRQGGMLAKGRLLGLQFIGLMKDGLYEALGKKADLLALQIKDGFAAAGCDFLVDSVTNQQFPILTRQQQEILGKKYAYSYWQPVDDGRDAVRFCTSWATKEEDVEELLKDIQNL
ncbi:MAG: aminotransferase class I/II-fold pyridoxal phosphate-dependent enzyme [Clostridiales bacterium]|nr:aminotransferase class I/II-fold pyridoxal phosphate-dependent enzyme [Clostridiales bacterium]